MPIYEYRCPRGHNFEVMQRMTDPPVTECQTCGRPVERVFHPVAVHFKGKGFYNTDYGTRQRQRELAQSAESGADKTAEKAGTGKGSGDGAKSADGASATKKSDTGGAEKAKAKADKPAAKQSSSSG